VLATQGDGTSQTFVVFKVEWALVLKKRLIDLSDCRQHSVIEK
jgi:hypothetical protein